MSSAADLDEDGSWSRGAAKWWNGCLWVRGAADHPHTGSPRPSPPPHHGCRLLLASWSETQSVPLCLQASIAAGQVSPGAPGVTIVQLPNGQTVQVHGVIQAAQPSVIQSPQVQAVQVETSPLPGSVPPPFGSGWQSSASSPYRFPPWRARIPRSQWTAS